MDRSSRVQMDNLQGYVFVSFTGLLQVMPTPIAASCIPWLLLLPSAWQPLQSVLFGFLTCLSCTAVGGIAVLPLPEGWEKKTDAQGTTFYVNHTLKTFSWSPPPLIDGPSADAGKSENDREQEQRGSQQRIREEEEAIANKQRTALPVDEESRHLEAAHREEEQRRERQDFEKRSRESILPLEQLAADGGIAISSQPPRGGSPQPLVRVDSTGGRASPTSLQVAMPPSAGHVSSGGGFEGKASNLGVLTVHVLEARDLPQPDGTLLNINPYVCVVSFSCLSDTIPPM